jgi:hypothetical protein
MKTHKVMVVSFGCALAVACADNLQVPETNVTPVAVARVLDDERVMPSFKLEGAALELTLDGSQSHDPDGSIRSHRWLRHRTLAAGRQRVSPRIGLRISNAQT